MKTQTNQPMTLKQRVRQILRKYPATKFNRGEFMWAYCVEYLRISTSLNKKQFLEFWKSEAGLERTLRDALKEKEFALSEEQDAKRYSKASKFRENALALQEQLFQEPIPMVGTGSAVI